MTASRSGSVDAPLRLGSARGRGVLLVTVLGSGMVMLDGTVVNVALPWIGTDLDAGVEGLQWTVNGYALTLASFVLLGGALGDRFGRRRVFLTGVVGFALASLVCGVAPSLEVLVAGRVLQGVAGALLTPGSLAIISASFHPDDRPRAIGLWSGLGGLAAALGPFAGGWLVTLDWHLVFLVNVPLAAITVLVAVRHVPESRDTSIPHDHPLRSLDPLGAVLAAVALGGITAALTGTGGEAARWATALVGALAAVAFLLVERRVERPMLPLGVFASRTFSGANAATALVYAALGGLLFMLVLQLQLVAGFGPLAAGTALVPMTVLMLLLSARSGALAQRVGARLPMTVGPLVCAAGVVLLMPVGAGARYVPDVLPGVVVFGLGLVTTVAPLTIAVLAAVPAGHAGVASGVNNAVARTGGLVAVAALPLVAGLDGADYRDPVAFDAAWEVSALVCAGLLAAGGLVSWLTVRTPVAEPDPGG